MLEPNHLDVRTQSLSVIEMSCFEVTCMNSLIFRW